MESLLEDFVLSCDDVCFEDEREFDVRERSLSRERESFDDGEDGGERERRGVFDDDLKAENT